MDKTNSRTIGGSSIRAPGTPAINQPSVKLAQKIKRRSLLRSHPAVKSPKLASRCATTIRSVRPNAINAPRSSLQPIPPTSRAAIGRSTTFGSTSVSRQGMTSVTSRTLRTSSTTPAASRGSLSTTAGKQKNTELEELKNKVSSLEAALASKTEAHTMSSEINTMLKDRNNMLTLALDTHKQKVEMLTMSLDELKSCMESKDDQLKFLKEQNEQMTNQLNEKEVILRQLHNNVVDLMGKIRIAIRVRPLMPTESDNSNTMITYPAVNSISITHGKKTAEYNFENVFTPVFSQEEVFSKVKDLILSCLHGYNVGLIAFGQTGSGKTYTMRGGEDSKKGVIPRSVDYLIEQSKNLEAIGWEFEFSISFIEIYNNEAYDLLKSREKLKLRLAGSDVAIDGLSSHAVKKTSDVTRLLAIADVQRKTAATKCNAESSRSHAIFQWTVKAHQKSTGISTTSVLKLVDLAGSERAKESGVTGDQFKEMTCINQSLSHLQMCINQQKKKSSHVPYRDSKLTQLLKDCLGAGSSKTMVIVNVNPCDEQVQESKRSIDFAAKMGDTNIGSAVQQRDLTMS